MSNEPISSGVPAEVYHAGDDKLSRRVQVSFKSELDPDVLRQKAIAHIELAIASLPDSVKMTSGDMPVPEDMRWLIAVLIRTFPPGRILRFSVAELCALIQQLMRRLDLNEVSSRDILTGPALMVAGSLMTASVALVSPLERALMASLSRSLAYLAPAALSVFQQDARVPSGEIPYSWRLQLSNSIRFLKAKNVTVDRSWARMRTKVLAADNAAKPSGLPKAAEVSPILPSAPQTPVKKTHEN